MQARAKGFSLIELLVAISIIATLAALLATSLSTAKEKARGTQCLDNHRQLQIAWVLYIEDNSGQLPRTNPFGGMGPGYEAWITFDPPNTNTAKLLTGFGSFGPLHKIGSRLQVPLGSELLSGWQNKNSAFP